MKVTIYVEGGGDSKELKIRCRQGFRKLVEKAGFTTKMPSIVACGGRDKAFEIFKTAMNSKSPTDYPMLLVDSEDIIAGNITPWNHLRRRETSWITPQRVSEDQAQLMATCMETWIMADRAALREFFGASLLDSALLPEANLEQYDRHQVLLHLERATHNCRNKMYKKGKLSFQVLEAVNPNTLKQRLPYFRRFIETLERLVR